MLGMHLFPLDLHHMCSSSDGFMVTMDASTGFYLFVCLFTCIYLFVPLPQGIYIL